MEKTILSIDFDIIMHSCITLYNDDVEGNDNPIELWGWLEEEYKLEDYNLLSGDFKTLFEIAKLLNYNKDKPIYFIDEHQEIIDILQERSEYNTDTYNIYNIDFHHDIWYDEDSPDEILDNDEYTCADWVGYLYLKKKLKQYTWLKAPNSDLLEIPIYGKNFNFNILRLSDFDKLYKINFDEIYVCLSPQWVPEKYHYLYNILELFLEKE